MTVTERKPSDPVNDYVDSYAWCCTGWEDAAEGSIREVEHATRGQAAAWFARELGESITGVSVWKRYLRPLTRAEVWDDYGADRVSGDLIDARGVMCKHDPARGEGLAAFWYEDEAGREVPEAEFAPPAEPPSDWEPDEYDPVWQFVHRSHPDAIAVWVCAVKGDDPPPNPKAKVVTLDSGDGVAPSKEAA